MEPRLQLKGLAPQPGLESGTGRSVGCLATGIVELLPVISEQVEMKY